MFSSFFPPSLKGLARARRLACSSCYLIVINETKCSTVYLTKIGRECSNKRKIKAAAGLCRRLGLPRTPAGTRDALSPAVARRAPFLTLVRACHVLVRGRDDTNSYCSIALGRRIHVARLRKRERCVSQPRWQKLFQTRVCRRTRAGAATGYSPNLSARAGAFSLKRRRGFPTAATRCLGRRDHDHISGSPIRRSATALPTRRRSWRHSIEPAL